MKSLNKDTLREIKNSKGRFLSILLMITIGVLVFIGLKITGPAMYESADLFFQKTNGADIVVTSTYGLEDEDIDLIKTASGIRNIDLGYEFDVETKNKDNLIRLNSITKTVNELNVIDGRLPKSSEEIVLDEKLQKEYSIGDKISFLKENIDIEKEEEYSINNYDFKIVGFITSPDYVDSINLGSSNIGDGLLTGVGFVEKSIFNLENYSTVKITFEDLKSFKFSEDKYKELAEKHKKEIEDILYKRKDEVFEEKKKEVSKEIADGEKEIADAKQKLEDAEIEITDAKQKLEDGYLEYEEGKEKLNSEISKARDELIKAQKEIDINKKSISNKQNELEEAEKEIKESKIKIDSGRKELDNAWSEYNTNKELLEGAINKYNEEIEKMNVQLKEIKDTLEMLPSISGQITQLENQKSEAESQLQQKNSELNDKQNKLNQVESQIVDIKKQLEDDPTNINLQNKLKELQDDKVNIENEISKLNFEISELNKTISDIKNKIFQLENLLNSEQILKENKIKLEEGIKKAESEKAVYEKNLDTLLESKKTLDEKEAEWKEGKTKYDSAVSTISNGRKQLAEGKEALKKAQEKVNSGNKTIEEEYKSGQNKLILALSELDENKKILEDNEKEFLDEKEKAEKEIADGEEDLDDAKRMLNILMAPRYTVESRENSSEIYTFYDEARRLGIISNVFPVFFFFIALLVSLTTMTRMVDEDRLEIGTLKALGYSNSQIIKKYFIYGGIASVLGSILGIIIGHTVISPLIFFAYASNYVFYSSFIPFNVFYSAMSLIIGVLCTAVAGAMASKSSLRENASNLMRGKPPKHGTRIFFERLKFIWKRLNFMEKVTMRNLFRYKRRMFMTIIGISGCTGLIFMGFGIKDSITSLEQKQYHELLNYDMISIYDEDFSPEGFKEYNNLITDKNKVEKSTPVVIDSFTIDVKGAPDQAITLISPEEKEELSEFVILRDRKNLENIKLKDDGVVITEKAAKVLKAKVGDTIKIKDSDSIEHSVKIGDIAENYSGHYVYMTSKYYNEIFDKDYEPNGDILKLTPESDKEKSQIIEEVNNNDSVLSIYNNSQVKEMIDTLLGTLDILVFVIIICSCTLAFVVLYNLTNINVSERLRELSTIKVLGFYDKEVTAYVYRETFILTILGIFLGYVLGFIMHYIIINNLVPDIVMLDPHIFLMNYILSAIITILFAVMVMLVVHRKLKHINMVEALKAVE
ncbi:FtsX-like permease family protein [Miniphocaeibacter massiliensis]|uniref:FtsX-like permease family protein n=1 Tax=Miniphocaeibacter massiliensis TaxID=2041841 RepID=UPI000C1B83E6|nr:FtsX-like permease family protein [Miniphocaeibacter massiliensis]